MLEAQNQGGTESGVELAAPKVEPVSDPEILHYLRCSFKIAEVATLAEQELVVIQACEQLGLTVLDQELQAAGDAFRLEHKLAGASETFAWLEKQRITVEEWSEGVRNQLLKQKLKERLFSNAIDIHYLGYRQEYDRVALSQILVQDLASAIKIVHTLKDTPTAFCALALEHSQAQNSRQNGGFVGVRFVSELLPEIKQAIADRQEGELIGPVQTQLGYHILKLEKRFPTHLSEAVRTEIMNTLFQAWLQTDGKTAA
jgi:parvulin-like peptidyl-prolyl isomerase